MEGFRLSAIFLCAILLHLIVAPFSPATFSDEISGAFDASSENWVVFGKGRFGDGEIDLNSISRAKLPRTANIRFRLPAGDGGVFDVIDKYEFYCDHDMVIRLDEGGFLDSSGRLLVKPPNKRSVQAIDLDSSRAFRGVYGFVCSSKDGEGPIDTFRRLESD